MLKTLQALSNGILSLDKNTLQSLHRTRPNFKKEDDEVLMSGEKLCVHPVIYEIIHEDLVKRATLKTRGDLGASGLNAVEWRKILGSNNYGTVNIDLWKALAKVIKKPCIKTLK